jgi:hypothetical protein
MTGKIKRTTFGVVTSHIISSSLLFPVVWLIAGSLGKALLIANAMATEPIASIVYYGVMLLSFFLGIKYSLYYINKKVEVAMPKQSGQQSIALFSILVIAVNYGLYYFEGNINYYRLVMSLGLVYLFAVMTKKYFNSLDKTDYLECSFPSQIIILLANFSLLVMLLLLFGTLQELYYPWVRVSIIAVVLTLAFASGLLNKPFVPFFYKEGEPKPLKNAFISLAVTLPVNAFFYTVIIKYFSHHSG